MDLSKVPKESIGKVHTCTLTKTLGGYSLAHYKNWSTFNGEKFCGVLLDGTMDRFKADKICKARILNFFKNQVQCSSL